MAATNVSYSGAMKAQVVGQMMSFGGRMYRFPGSAVAVGFRPFQQFRRTFRSALLTR